MRYGRRRSVSRRRVRGFSKRRVKRLRLVKGRRQRIGYRLR